MKKSVIILILLLLLQLLSVAAYADTYSGGCHSLQAGQMLAAGESFKGTAKAVILYELNTQTLVYARNPDERINPTGLVKLLTALIVLEEGNLEDVVTVNRSTLNSVGIGAVSAGLKAGEQLKLKDLLFCVMVSSANDAAAVIAEHVAGSQAAFVDKMNARAATLGCVNTHFANVHGLQDDRQYSTARDLAIIVEEALKNEQFAELFAATEHFIPATNLSSSRQLSTTNYMMDPDSKYYDARVTGGKPAAAKSSDRSMACIAQSGESRYLCIVISAKAKMSGSSITRYTNFDETSDLLDIGFEGYSVQQVLGIGQPFSMYPVSNGNNHVVVGPSEEVYALLPVDFDATQLQFRDVRQTESLVAPLTEGSVVGTLQIFYKSILIGEADLLARHDVAVLGTTITTDTGDGTTNSGAFSSVLKWIGIILVCILAMAVVALLVLRKINHARYQQKKRRKAVAEKRRDV